MQGWAVILINLGKTIVMALFLGVEQVAYFSKFRLWLWVFVKLVFATAVHR